MVHEHQTTEIKERMGVLEFVVEIWEREREPKGRVLVGRDEVKKKPRFFGFAFLGKTVVRERETRGCIAFSGRSSSSGGVDRTNRLLSVVRVVRRFLFLNDDRDYR